MRHNTPIALDERPFSSVVRGKKPEELTADEVVVLDQYIDALDAMLKGGIKGWFMHGIEEKHHLTSTDVRKLYSEQGEAIHCHVSGTRRDQCPCNPCFFDVRAFANEIRA